MNRERFEALSEIKSRLISVKFNERLGRYESRSPVIIECFESALWLNGAYYAFCEQEKTIQMQECGVKAILEIIDSIVPYEYDLDTMSKINKIKEVLK